MAESPMERTPPAMAAYRRTARTRDRVRRERLVARRSRAWEVACQAAVILREEFGAERVVLFGSLVGPARFHLHSDIDLAVWGLEARQYYRAVARLLDLDPAIGVDLVEVEYARPGLRAAIEREGVLL